MLINEQEIMLCDRSESEFTDKQLPFTDHDLRRLVVTAYYNWTPIDVEGDRLTAKDFHASNRFIYIFKWRYSFSSHQVHYRRRPSQMSRMNQET
jgi:hypothetical protein